MILYIANILLHFPGDKCFIKSNTLYIAIKVHPSGKKCVLEVENIYIYIYICMRVFGICAVQHLPAGTLCAA